MHGITGDSSYRSLVTWRPLSQRHRADTTEFDALHEGVPAWLRSSLFGWINGQLLYRPAMGGSVVDADRLKQLERRLRLEELNWRSTKDAQESLLNRCNNDPDLFLDVLDALVATLSGPDVVTDLKVIVKTLDEGGSAWTIGRSEDNRFQLERRIDHTVVDAARSTVAGAGRAGQYLANAWSATYGRRPNPSHAYREAVRAVETAAIPTVCPNDGVATLGRIIGQLRAGKGHAVALHPAKGSPADALIAMLELLWTAQLDRHGTADPTAPLTVTDTEARTAVHLATTLVQWFSSDGIVAP